MVVWGRISLERHLCQIGESINLFIPSKAIKSNGIYNTPIISVNSHKQTSTLHPHPHTKNYTNSQKKNELSAQWNGKMEEKRKFIVCGKNRIEHTRTHHFFIRLTFRILQRNYFGFLVCISNLYVAVFGTRFSGRIFIGFLATWLHPMLWGYYLHDANIDDSWM